MLILLSLLLFLVTSTSLVTETSVLLEAVKYNIYKNKEDTFTSDQLQHIFSFMFFLKCKNCVLKTENNLTPSTLIFQGSFLVQRYFCNYSCYFRLRIGDCMLLFFVVYQIY